MAVELRGQVPIYHAVLESTLRTPSCHSPRLPCEISSRIPFGAANDHRGGRGSTDADPTIGRILYRWLRASDKVNVEDGTPSRASRRIERDVAL